MGFEGLGDLMCSRCLSQETPKPRRCDAGWIIVIRQSKTILAHQKSDRRRVYLCAGGLRRRARAQKSPIASDTRLTHPAIKNDSSAILLSGRAVRAWRVLIYEAFL